MQQVQDRRHRDQQDKLQRLEHQPKTDRRNDRDEGGETGKMMARVRQADLDEMVSKDPGSTPPTGTPPQRS